MHPTVKALKEQILRTHPSKLKKVIQEKFVVDREGLFSVHWLTDALAAAIRERPSIADAICPWLAKSNDYDLMPILVEILPALWPYRAELLLKVLDDALRSKDRNIQKLLKNTLSIYKDLDQDFDEGFRRFLIEEGY